MNAGSERKNSRIPPWQQEGGEGDKLSFGAWLRRQREMREIPLREIADVTKISVRYLEALEQDRFDVLPAPVFAKGFLREYSRYVGLDPDEVVNSFLLALEPEDPDEAEEAASSGSSEWVSGLVLVLAIAALLAVVAALIVYAGRVRERAPETPPPIAAPPVVAVEPPPEPVEEEPAAEVPLLVTMDFTEDCWVEMEVDGERRVSELHVQGESVRLEASERVVLTLGNPAGVRIEVNGRLLEVEGPPGRVARDVEITLATAEALRAPA